MTEATDLQDKLAEISKARDRFDRDQARADRSRDELFTLIRDAFPDEPERGLLTKVCAASRFTREYVARIRDDKIPGWKPAPKEN